MIGRNQTGIVHGSGKTRRLVLQCAGVHRLKALLIHLQARILAAGLGGTKQAADQSVGALPADTQLDGRIDLTDRNLGDHALDAVHLNGPLLQNPPDFLNQLVDDVFVANPLRQVSVQRSGNQRETPLLLSLRLAGRPKEQLQVNGQHLGQIMMGLLRGHTRVLIIAQGNGEQTQLADSFNHHRRGIRTFQRVRSQ